MPNGPIRPRRCTARPASSGPKWAGSSACGTPRRWSSSRMCCRRTRSGSRNSSLRPGTPTPSSPAPVRGRRTPVTPTRTASRPTKTTGRIRRMSAASASGLVIVDKPGGMTSHDVVARVRRLAGTRKVGHAGTLDPMATGVLLVGVEKATRLLGYLTLTEKEYSATIRLGQTTSTDDAEGEITGTATAEGVTIEAIDQAVAGLTGEILQVPPAVSAIKVGGPRAYKLSRAGAAPELAAPPVTGHQFNPPGIR